MAKTSQSKGRKDGLVAENRRARRDYAVEDTLEAGIVLVGSEVKSLREGRANIAESYAAVEHGELWLINADIPIYTAANRFNHEPKRRRKLLVSRRELARLGEAADRAGRTIVPLKLYFNERGLAKLLLGIATGRKAHDKRDVEAKRDWQRQKARLMRES
ncbi:MAG: SsrA-binding protein SmpB [Hyphomonadaceae bacterium]|nr:SsrA-binding protein SmpB [Hyphomonadaceae bacterium]